GSGGLTVSGGTETLTGANTYTGATTISGGTLQLGDGGTTGSLSDSSAIHDNGQLTIDHGNAFAMAQTIDGTGSLTQAGTGRTTLSGVNTYSGGTAITGGTLVGTTSSFGSGGIVDNAALEVSQDTSGTLANTLSGNGSFTKSGTGTVAIDGDDSAFTGTTDISAGMLDVDGSLANSAVTVDNGGTLSGTGTVGSTNVAAGGILSPAGSGTIGTLNVNGTLDMATGSILAADGNATMTGTSLSVDNQSYQQLTSDLVKVSGAAALSGGTVDFHVADGTALKYGEAYTLVSAAGGVSGKYTNLSTNIVNDYTFMSPTLVYTANDVDLLMQRNGTSFSEAGNTRNERETGRGLDDLPDTSSVVKAMEQLNGNSARKGLDALSGEVHASARTALIQDSFFARQAVFDRLASADCDGPVDSTIRTADLKHRRRTDGHCYSDRAVMWGEAFGSLGSNSGDGNAASMHHSTAGFIMGADAPVADTWRVGGLISYGSNARKLVMP
ncbi:autotransporter-associated beta strand repeat-containing protein, partial [Gluconacetobacter entanii]|uniref:autotransporter outer membrane beta-barrel domain-containing protein n=2 Tax=Gluconacetobacter entanii TaxID=108528 RepID=UPI001C936A2A